MKPAQLAFAVVALAAVVIGVVLLLAPEDDGATPVAMPPSEPYSLDGLPDFSSDLGEARPAEPIAVPASEAGAGREDERRDGGPGAREAAGRRTVRGRVVREADASPLEGARVFATDIAAGPHDSPQELAGVSTVTAADGGFELQVLFETARLYVMSDNAWPARTQSFRIEPGEGTLPPQQLEFDSGFLLSGLVLDEAGRRLGDALVDVNSTVETHADESGHFEFRDVAPEAGVGSVRVSARAPGHASASVDALVPPRSSETVEVELRLPPGGAIAGRVTDAGGAPLAGVQASVAFVMSRNHGGAAPGGLFATSDAQGEYRIESVPEGRYVVEVGYGAGLARSGGEFALDGTLELPGLSPESSLSMGARVAKQVAALKGLALRWFPEIVVDPGQTTRLDVVLYPPASLSGRVLDETGAPVTGALVTLEHTTQWPAPDATGNSITTSAGLSITSRTAPDGRGRTVLAEVEGELRTDALGAYAFTGLKDGEKRLAVTAEGLVGETQSLDLQPAEVLAGVDFLLERGLTVRGRVRDAAGAPVAGALVDVKALDDGLFTSGELTTDAEGRFAISGLPPGPKQLLVFKTGFASLWKHVEPGAEDLDLVLAAAPTVVGRVTHAVHGGPITNFDVSISFQNSTWANTGGSYPDGRFELPIDSNSPCTVTVRSAGFREVVLEGVLPSRTAQEPLRIQLRPQ